MAQLASQLGHQSSNPDAALAYGVLRLTVGLDCLFHSVTRWSHIGSFADKVVSQIAGTPLLERVWVRHWITIWEPIVVGLLVCGLRRRDALVAGGFLIAALVFGTAVRGDFTVLAEQLVYALIVFVLLLYRRENDRRSVDRLIARRSIGVKA